MAHQRPSSLLADPIERLSSRYPRDSSRNKHSTDMPFRLRTAKLSTFTKEKSYPPVMRTGEAINIENPPNGLITAGHTGHFGLVQTSAGV